MNAYGDFVIVWDAREPDGNYHIYSRYYRHNGDPLGDAKKISSHSSVNSFPKVVMLSTGQYAVAWLKAKPFFVLRTRVRPKSQIQIFNVDGAAASSPFELKDSDNHGAFVASIKTDIHDNLIVMWHSRYIGPEPEWSYNGLYTQRFNSEGNALNEPLQILAPVSEGLWNATLAASGDGSFVVTWSESSQSSHVFYQVFSEESLPTSEKTIVSNDVLNSKHDPFISINLDGDRAIVWESKNQDGYLGGIYAHWHLSASNAVSSQYLSTLPPRAIAEGNNELIEGATGHITASSSFGFTEEITYSWRQLSGPNVSIFDARSSSFNFVAPHIDESTVDITFEVQVQDENGYIDSDQITVTVHNKGVKPVAVIHAPAFADVGEIITLDASSSYDLNGTIQSYEWRAISTLYLEQREESEVIFSNTQTATYTIQETPFHKYQMFELKVTDNEGLSAYDVIIVNLNGFGDPPVVNAGDDIYVNEGDVVNLDAVLEGHWYPSSDNDVFLSSLFSRVSIFQAPDVESSVESFGFYFFKKGTNLLASIDYLEVHVHDIPSSPPEPLVIVDITAESTVKEGELLKITPTLSDAGQPSDITFNWIQTEGPHAMLFTPNAEEPVFYAPSVGSLGATITFELTVTNKHAQASVESISINVTNNASPTANAGADLDILEGEVFSLTATQSNDPDGEIVT